VRRRASQSVRCHPHCRACFLAAKSGTAAETVQGFESRGSDPKLSTLNKWYRALEAAGVEFIDEDAERGPGVRLHKVKAAGKRK
jgi:transcriptional regulator with XRE-family HTH domain